MLVLVLRGQVLRAYPNVAISAVKAVWSDTVHGPRRELGALERRPAFRGTLPPDILFLGFALTLDEARGSADPKKNDAGWFFVLQEQPTESRFGLDEAPTGATLPLTLGSWDELSWAHLVETDAELASMTHASPRARAALQDFSVPELNWRWGRNAAHMAQITLQKPVQLAVHADVLLPLAPMAAAREGLAAVVAPDGRIYALGGRGESGPLASVEAYDPVTGTWSPLAPIAVARQALAAVVGRDGRIYAVGGRGDDGHLLTTFESHTASS
jgi:hypothetical protein